MSALLKDILLRHQKWEEEELGCKNESSLSQTDCKAKTKLHHTASSFEKALLQSTDDGSVALPLRRTNAENRSSKNNSDCATSFSSGSSAVAAPSFGTSLTEQNGHVRYRTRPPALRTAPSINSRQGAPPSSSPTVASTSASAGASVPHDPVPAANFAPPLPSSASSPPVASSPSPSLTATLALPFDPYPVQQEMGSAIHSVLTSSKPHVVPVAVTEVPTGCGKTMALLSGVLRYQQDLKRMTPKEAESYLAARRPPWQQREAPARQSGKGGRRSARGGGNVQQLQPEGSAENGSGNHSPSNADSEGGEDSPWTVPRSFFKHFRVNSQRKIRAELDVTGSQELRRRFVPPPCTIYYATRTHAQLRQAVRELRRLHGASSAIRMNILGSRERYCIHPKVVHAKANHTLPVEGNNLGEVCDKLVSMGLCEMVDKYDELSCSAIGGSIGHQQGLVWDMEDLVLEGSARSMCPYYAARDLVFFADINFCTYQYLLDPLIRHETKMEAALKNNAIVVFDEAHNVSAVCQDALSLECPRSVLDLILSELEPLVSNRHTLARQAASTTGASATAFAHDGFATMQYPRELHLGTYTLVELFTFLFSLFQSISAFFDELLTSSSPSASSSSFFTNSGVAHGGTAAQHHFAEAERRGEKRSRTGGDHGGSDEAYTQGSDLEHRLRSDMEAFVRTLRQNRGADNGKNAKSSPAVASLDLFQRAYGVIMALGVTFNPFLFSVFGLSMLKRWLLLLRFLFQKPRSFVLTAHSASVGEGGIPAALTRTGHFGETSDSARVHRGADPSSARATPAHATVEVRCLDGSLAFGHLLQSVHRVVLASGTLSPFTQLSMDLGLRTSQWRTVEGLHVVPATQYRLTALTALPGAGTQFSSATSTTTMPLRCTYTSLANPAFLKAVARCVVQLAQTVQRGSGGGVLFFVPNYAVLHALAKIARELLLVSAREQPSGAPAIQLFLEPRKAEALTEVLHQFQLYTQAPQCNTALFFSVYRGKVSEGIDFTDEMARLVVCLGVPLQPLKSWKVIAQRAYSGGEWYTTDAVRAVNQALGRCLRHVRDYGAVVLLDERYAQAEYQQRLSRWCRAALQTESSLTQLCDDLAGAFAEWRRELGTSRGAVPSHGVGAVSAHSEATASRLPLSCNASRRGLEVESQLTEESQRSAGDENKSRLGTDQLPFQRVHRTAQRLTVSKKDKDAEKDGERNTGEPYQRGNCGTRVASAEVKAGESVQQSPFACTAVKLLYEMAQSTSDVSREDLQAAVALLAENFADDPTDGDEVVI